MPLQLLLPVLAVVAVAADKQPVTKHVVLARPYKVEARKEPEAEEKRSAANDRAFRPETDPNKKKLDVYESTSPATRRAGNPSVVETVVTSVVSGKAQVPLPPSSSQ